MERKFNFAVGEFYHLYNRGTERRKIFLNQSDQRRFLALLYVCNGRHNVHLSNFQYQGRPLIEIFQESISSPIVDIGAYCLMPNHFHLLVREKEPGGISRFMLKVTTGYSMYFNKRYERGGNLFQGRFQASHVDDDEYLKYLFAYIHLNPIKLIDGQWRERGIKNPQGAEQHLLRYPASSYRDYLGDQERPERKIINRAAFPEYFSSPRDFSAFVGDWLNYRQQG